MTTYANLSEIEILSNQYGSKNVFNGLVVCVRALFEQADREKIDLPDGYDAYNENLDLLQAFVSNETLDVQVAFMRNEFNQRVFSVAKGSEGRVFWVHIANSLFELEIASVKIRQNEKWPTLNLHKAYRLLSQASNKLFGLSRDHDHVEAYEIIGNMLTDWLEK